MSNTICITEISCNLDGAEAGLIDTDPHFRMHFRMEIETEVDPAPF